MWAENILTFQIFICNVGREHSLAVVLVGDTGTIPYHLRNLFPGAPGDRGPGAGDGCGISVVC